MKHNEMNWIGRVWGWLPASWRWQRNRRYWNRAWGAPDFTAPWLGRSVSKEIVIAAAQGWFPSGGAALDIGCGQGEVVGWLAEHGFAAVGIDISSAAIARARARFGEVAGRLEFFVSDIRAGTPAQRFSILVDRGCLHQIPTVDVPAYARNVASLCGSGARFLLFMRAFRGGIAPGDPEERSRVVEQVRRALGSEFSIDRVAETHLDPYDGQRPESALPGLVFWMTRR